MNSKVGFESEKESSIKPITTDHKPKTKMFESARGYFQLFLYFLNYYSQKQYFNPPPSIVRILGWGWV